MMKVARGFLHRESRERKEARKGMLHDQTDGQTGGQTDRRTDGLHDHRKRKKGGMELIW